MYFFEVTVPNRFGCMHPRLSFITCARGAPFSFCHGQRFTTCSCVDSIYCIVRKTGGHDAPAFVGIANCIGGSFYCITLHVIRRHLSLHAKPHRASLSVCTTGQSSVGIVHCMQRWRLPQGLSGVNYCL